jgi:hypothetical protein
MYPSLRVPTKAAAAKQHDFSFLSEIIIIPLHLLLQTVLAFHDDNQCFSSTYHGGKFGCKTIPSNLLSQE